MPGIKGQKWAAEKRSPKKVKVNIQLLESEYLKIKEIAEKNDWSISKTIYNVCIKDKL